jgi:hypothetical protein
VLLLGVIITLKSSNARWQFESRRSTARWYQGLQTGYRGTKKSRNEDDSLPANSYMTVWNSYRL